MSEGIAYVVCDVVRESRFRRPVGALGDDLPGDTMSGAAPLMSDDQVDRICAAIRSISHGGQGAGSGPEGMEMLSIAVAGEGLAFPLASTVNTLASTLEDAIDRMTDAVGRMAGAVEAAADPEPPEPLLRANLADKGKG